MRSDRLWRGSPTPPPVGERTASPLLGGRRARRRGRGRSCRACGPGHAVTRVVEHVGLAAWIRFLRMLPAGMVEERRRR